MNTLQGDDCRGEICPPAASLTQQCQLAMYRINSTSPTHAYTVCKNMPCIACVIVDLEVVCMYVQLICNIIYYTFIALATHSFIVYIYILNVYIQGCAAFSK